MRTAIRGDGSKSKTRCRSWLDNPVLRVGFLVFAGFAALPLFNRGNGGDVLGGQRADVNPTAPKLPTVPCGVEAHLISNGGQKHLLARHHIGNFDTSYLRAQNEVLGLVQIGDAHKNVNCFATLKADTPETNAHTNGLEKIKKLKNRKAVLGATVEVHLIRRDPFSIKSQCGAKLEIDGDGNLKVSPNKELTLRHDIGNNTAPSCNVQRSGNSVLLMLPEDGGVASPHGEAVLSRRGGVPDGQGQVR